MVGEWGEVFVPSFLCVAALAVVALSVAGVAVAGWLVRARLRRRGVAPGNWYALSPDVPARRQVGRTAPVWPGQRPPVEGSYVQEELPF